MLVGSRRVRTCYIFACLSLIVLGYLAYSIYIFIGIRTARNKIYKSLNKRYNNCDSLKVHLKRATFQELLREWVKIAKRNDINYVLLSGSLLGQYRNSDVNELCWHWNTELLTISYKLDWTIRQVCYNKTSYKNRSLISFLCLILLSLHAEGKKSKRLIFYRGTNKESKKPEMRFQNTNAHKISM